METGERMGEGLGTEFVNMCTLFYLKWITNKNLIHRTCNSAQGSVAAWMGASLGESAYMYMYG